MENEYLIDEIKFIRLQLCIHYRSGECSYPTVIDFLQAIYQQQQKT